MLNAAVIFTLAAFAGFQTVRAHQWRKAYHDLAREWELDQERAIDAMNRPNVISYDFGRQA